MLENAIGMPKVATGFVLMDRGGEAHGSAEGEGYSWIEVVLQAGMSTISLRSDALIDSLFPVCQPKLHRRRLGRCRKPLVCHAHRKYAGYRALPRACRHDAVLNIMGRCSWYHSAFSWSSVPRCREGPMTFPIPFYGCRGPALHRSNRCRLLLSTETG